MHIDNSTLKSVALGAAVAASSWFLLRKTSSASARAVAGRIPTEWLEIGSVEQLFLYPLKSGAGIRCEEFSCTQQGPQLGDSRDRIVAVVSEDGTLVTGRDYPLLTQVTAEVSGDVLTLGVPGQLPFALNLKTLPLEKTQYLKIWKQHAEGVDCGDEVAALISRFLGSGARLLYYPHRHQGKDVYRRFLEMPFVNNTDGGAFSDALSFHLVNEASVRDLNSRLETPVQARNFRPNIVIQGEKLNPYEEDHWEWLRVGDVVFRALAPCTRCLMTTINPDNGERSEVFEPVKTLRKYRVLRDPAKKDLFGPAPVMGVYLGVRQTGVIHAGDTVSVGIA